MEAALASFGCDRAMGEHESYESFCLLVTWRVNASERRNTMSWALPGKALTYPLTLVT